MTFKEFITKALSPIFGRGGRWNPPVVHEPWSGAWASNQEQSREDILAYHAIFSCITLISGDCSKLNLRLVRQDNAGIWNEVYNSAYSPVLRKPNRYQTRIQFFESWLLSILTSGNTYVLKKRDHRQVVTELFILDPSRVQPLVSEGGEIWYELNADNVVGLVEPIRVPASEIIHDRMCALYHPLIGISPVVACALPVLQAREIQKSGAAFFANNARPGGILTAPGAVSDETAEQLRTYWKENYTGNNSGSVAVLADGLQYKSFDQINAANSQVIETLKWTAEVVCSVFHVPPTKIGVGEVTYQNVEALNVEYLNTALMVRLENIELLLNEGLRLPNDLSTEFEVSNLLRMDSLAQMEVLDKAKGKLTVNEMRKVLNRKPLTGGDSVFLQQQEFSLEALAKRDAREDPFASTGRQAETAKMLEITKKLEGMRIEQ